MSFAPERLYVPLDEESESANRLNAAHLRHTGVRLAFGANATERTGVMSFIKQLGVYRFNKTFADMHYSSVGNNIQKSLSLFEELPSIGYVSVDGRDSERSLATAASFNNGLQVVAKGIDSDMSEAEYLRRFGRTIEQDTHSMCETALANKIGAVMVAGCDVELVTKNYPDLTVFALGIRPEQPVEGLGHFAEDQERIIDPIRALEAGDDKLMLFCGRPITSASEPEVAVHGLLEYINRG